MKSQQNACAAAAMKTARNLSFFTGKDDSDFYHGKHNKERSVQNLGNHDDSDSGPRDGNGQPTSEKKKKKRKERMNNSIEPLIIREGSRKVIITATSFLF